LGTGDLDVEQLMRRARERAAAQAPPVRSPATGGTHMPGLIGADVAALHTSYDIQRVELTSHRSFLGPFIVRAKHALRRLLTPIFERQVAYNAANTRVTAHLVERLEVLTAEREHQRTVREDVDRLAQALEEQARIVSSLEGRLGEAVAAREALERRLTEAGASREALERRLEETTALASAADASREAVRTTGERTRVLGDRVARAERKLRRVLLHLAEGVEDVTPPRPAAPDTVLPSALAPTFDYAGFEDRFRGDEEDIRDRQRQYLAVFEGQQDVLDVGCGRGEFLELCRSAGIGARGVELDLDMVLLCREKGLDVIHGEVFAYLATLPDESLGGVFSAQVIEHLPPAAVVELVRLCHRKLRMGARAIFETPNPGCLAVFARSFYIDPTHIRPIHSDGMKFVLESLGFDPVAIQYSMPVETSARISLLPENGVEAVREFNRGVERLNDLIFGFQDYAVIGTKARRVP
jgi:SAM-dependent methyltransferase